jgi:hypothetical protein
MRGRERDGVASTTDIHNELVVPTRWRDRIETYAAVRLANDVFVELPFKGHGVDGRGQQKDKTGISIWELRGVDKPATITSVKM